MELSLEWANFLKSKLMANLYYLYVRSQKQNKDRAKGPYSFFFPKLPSREYLEVISVCQGSDLTSTQSQVHTFFPPPLYHANRKWVTGSQPKWSQPIILQSTTNLKIWIKQWKNTFQMSLFIRDSPIIFWCLSLVNSFPNFVSFWLLKMIL